MPSRTDQRVAASAIGVRSRSSVSTSVPTHRTMIEDPMRPHSAVFSGVERLKWLVVPRTTCVTMTAYSTSATPTITVETRCARRRRPRSSENSQAQVTE